MIGTTSLNINDPAPSFTLPNQDGMNVNLDDYKGQWVVLYFYPKDNTSGCTKEACEFTDNISEFEKLDATVIGVSPDSPKSHANFIVKRNLKITLLSDKEKQVLPAYGAWGLKKMCGREYEGVIRTTFLIDPDGKIAHIWPKVKVNGHVDAVKERLIQLCAEVKV